MDDAAHERLSRRAFIVLSTAPVLAGALGIGLAGWLPVDGVFGLPVSVLSESHEGFPSYQECSECNGRRFIRCPACDGTGAWTAESESAGLYRREAAQQADYCAWCDGTGEAECDTCAARGVVTVSAYRGDFGSVS